MIKCRLEPLSCNHGYPHREIPLRDIVDERIAQDYAWGEQNHPPDQWLTILGEEYGEVCRAVLDDDMVAYRKELIQVAAVAVAMIECLERNDGHQA